MKTTVAGTLIALYLWVTPVSAFHLESSTNSTAMQLNEEVGRVEMRNFTAPLYKPGVVRHIVLFRYKDTVTQAERETVTRRFLALRDKCLRNAKPYIISIETGHQHSGEGVNQGLQQAFVVTFRSQGDRNYYVGRPIVSEPEYYDPIHQVFKDFVGPLLAESGVLVFDYTVEQAAS